MGDVLVRTIFSLGILAAGWWLPTSYLDKHAGLWIGAADLVEPVFLLTKLMAFIYGAMALWSLRCAFVALWTPHQK